MKSTTDPMYWPVFWFVMLSWFVFAGVFLLRKRPPAPPQRAREASSVGGIILVGVGMAIVWSARRPATTPLIAGPFLVTDALDVLAIATAIGSVWMTLAAVRTLGKQWNVRAALVEDHKLITTGPYRLVRHPIYLGMLGLLVATGVAGSQSYALLIAIVVALTGTIVRIQCEERLLLKAFGREFEAYRKSVPALLPWVF